MFLRWMSRISFYHRILGSFVILILIPFVVITYNSYTNIRQDVIGSIGDANDNVVQAVTDQLMKTVGSISFASAYFAEMKDPAMLDSMRALSRSASFADYDTFRHYSRMNRLADVLLVQTFEAGLRLFMLGSGDRVIMGNLSARVFSVYDDRPFLEARNAVEHNALTLQWFPVGTTDDGAAFVYASRIIADPVTNRPLATLFVGIPDSYFAKLFRSHGEGSITLLDADGAVIARSESRAAPPSGETIRTALTMPQTGWTLVYETPLSEATGRIARQFLVSALATALFFTLFVVASVYLARGITTPILRLRNTARLYVGGNRDVRMPVTGKDEMALLATAFNRMLDDIDRLIEQVETEQEEKRVLELQALFSQIRPHFLLNTLNTIKVKLVMAGDSLHSRMLDSLIALLRSYVRVHEPAAIAEECRLLEDYVRIMEIRSKLEIAFRWTADEGAAGVTIPRLLLQPIVENAILHGFALHPERPAIDIRARRGDGFVTIEITDNGRGMPADKREALANKLRSAEAAERTGGTPSVAPRGVGLVNVARRLRLHFGTDAELRVSPGAEGGMTFVLWIPETGGEEVTDDVQSNAH
ncbi:HAMP domain-containing protein [Paenibacillus antri]|uniref:histidine kinase n=1 Tax=Paenibacillus antri TaxID=2582848 RepID=A0A5R9G5K5_9BACL|nr:histidine kinase [Paenibacillus antri]TLS48234.1 HAMP domain-containing protein [Paenibacillus antri]